MCGHGAKRGDNPAVSGPTLAGLLATRQTVQARDANAVGTGERRSVTVRRAIVERVAKVRSVHDRARCIAASIALPEAWRTRRGFPSGGIGNADTVMPPARLGDHIATPAKCD